MFDATSFAQAIPSGPVGCGEKIQPALIPAPVKPAPDAATSPAREEAPPARALMLGACDDGLPYLVDLDRPEGGPLLVAGDAGCGKTRLLQAMVASAAQMNPASSVQFAVISPDLEAWESFARSRALRGYCLGVYHPFEQDAGRLILDLADLVALRQSGRDSGARRETILWVIDDLAPLTALTFEVQARAHALLDGGTQARIWPLASLDTAHAAAMPFWTVQFRTRVLGRTADRRTASRLALNPVVGCEHLRSGQQFQAWYGSEWVNLWALPGDWR